MALIIPALDPAEQCELELGSQTLRDDDRVFAGTFTFTALVYRSRRREIEQQQGAFG